MSEGGDLIKLDVETGHTNRDNGMKSRRQAKLVSRMAQMVNIDDLRSSCAKLTKDGKLVLN